MIKRLSTMLCVAMAALSLYGCGSSSGESLKDKLEEAAVAEETTQETTEEPEEAEEIVEETPEVEITLNEVQNWYVGDIWNTLVDFQSYVSDGTNCMGGEFDPDFAYSQYQKALEDKDKYTDYIHENHPDIADVWDKTMEQLEVVNENLADGYDTGSDYIDLDLLQQYSDPFLDYCREN